MALVGFYHKAGVNLVREQIEARFAPAAPAYDVAGDWLIVWPGQDYQSEIAYNLRSESDPLERVVKGSPPIEPPVLRADEILFNRRPVPWAAWVETWEREQASEEPSALAPVVHLLSGKSSGGYVP